ncbi:hypothetical protein EX895_001520 [Sporisorium graminicola]|uniref:NAD-dependent epimerase/dehydratase domain-containing protein n=1 Tax=Sporisorium graminicola TaxID=280036 RepID=A0A4U7KY10_9BASI|nr:hypothetical protein EX895_001520 [Sporisorium graminicola]TKY89735.1 hypothetical protein EX895_001520 [Sporisorium graminicola]
MSQQPRYLVTGANGYIASALVKRLVDDGAHVRATVRREAAGEALRDMLSPGAKGSLEIAIVGDITASGAFRDALQGATHVFHMASPIPGEGKTDAKRDFLDPAVAGTLSLIRDANHATSTVRKIVLTASIASIMDVARANQGGTFTESDWNPVTYDQAIALGAQLDVSNAEDYIKAAMQVYAASKKLAEKAAWDFTTENKPSFALTTVHPAFVIGRSATKGVDLTGTNGMFWQALTTRPLQADRATSAYVDLEDTVEGHIKAMEKEEANGRRFILVGDQPLIADVINWAKAHGGSQLPFERVQVPENADEIKSKVTRFDVSATESVLGIRFKSMQQTVEDFVDWVTEVKK